MNNNEFWAVFMKVFGAVLIVLILGLSVGGAWNSLLMGKAIENGSNAIDAGCAFKMQGQDYICILRASKTNKGEDK